MYMFLHVCPQAMGEQLITAHHGRVPLLIFRPSIVGSSWKEPYPAKYTHTCTYIHTWKEPYPGWVDNVSAAGAVFLTSGMGLLTILPGTPHLPLALTLTILPGTALARPLHVP